MAHSANRERCVIIVRKSMADKRSFLAHLVELNSTYEKIHSLPHLSAFEAAARLGSFSAAADELFLTTGAVSRHIRSLEEQLGITLFYRGHKSVRLTQAGENFSAPLRG